jgi:hypothetical protein
MPNKYAKYAVTDTVRVRLEPVVVKSDFAILYRNNELVEEPRLSKIIHSVPKTMKPLPKINAVNVAILGKVIKNAKGSYAFLAESIYLAKQKKPFMDLTAQQLLWERKFFTPLFLQKFLVFKGQVKPSQAKSQILAAKKFLLSYFKGSIKLLGLKKV